MRKVRAVLSSSLRHSFELAVLDLTHPQLEGYESLRHMQEVVRPLPLVVVANHESDQLKKVVDQLGILDLTSEEKFTAEYLYRTILIYRTSKKQRLSGKGVCSFSQPTRPLNREGYFALTERQAKLAHRLDKQIVVIVMRPQWAGDPTEDKHMDGKRSPVAPLANILERTCRSEDIVGRVGEDLLAVSAFQTGDPSPLSILTRIRDRLNIYNMDRLAGSELSMDAGFSSLLPDEEKSAELLVSEAQKAFHVGTLPTPLFLDDANCPSLR